MSTEPLIRFTIPGRAYGKKTSPSVIYPGIARLKLKKTPAMLRRAKARANGGRVSNLIMGPRDLMEYLGELSTRTPSTTAKVAVMARDAVNPVVVPPQAHKKWNTAALKAIRRLKCPRPLAPEGHVYRVDCIVYMDKGQRGDLINFEESLWDALQEGELIPSDHWINHHGDSRRVWDDPSNPRMEVEIYDLGEREVFKLPKVTVRGLPDADNPFPISFSIRSPDGRRLSGNAPKGTRRQLLVFKCYKLWGSNHGEPLPEGSVIACGRASDEVQAGLFND